MKVGIEVKGLGVVRILQYVDLTRRSPLCIQIGSRRLLCGYMLLRRSMYGVTGRVLVITCIYLSHTDPQK